MISDMPDAEEQSDAEHDGNDLFGSPVNSQCADEPEDGATWSDVAGVPNRATGTAYVVPGYCNYGYGARRWYH